MTTVTLDEARDQLPDLVRRVTAGERVVLTDGGKWVAVLAAPPPMPPTPEEEAAARAARERAIEDVLRWRVEDGQPLPDGMTVRDVLDKLLRRA